MYTKTLEALKESIRHWDRMATGKRNEGEGISPRNCALCQAFNKYSGCHGCPVFEKTGKHWCDGSPYHMARDMALFQGLDSNKFRASALVERDFLISLLPKGETWDEPQSGGGRAEP